MFTDAEIQLLDYDMTPVSKWKPIQLHPAPGLAYEGTGYFVLSKKIRRARRAVVRWYGCDGRLRAHFLTSLLDLPVAAHGGDVLDVNVTLEMKG